jgi:phage terminase large subunit-like protein
MINLSRISVPQGFPSSLSRIVVAVDPPATSGESADDCGIVVAGVLRDASLRAVPRQEATLRPEEARDARRQEGPATAFVLADRSLGGLSPRQWAARAVAAYHEFCADRILVETNQGGEMVREIVRGVDPTVAVREVHATRGKRLRAEPVAALYEQGLVRHVASFPQLEDQMTSFVGEGGKSPGKSPDRLDALVWALTDLMLRPAGEPRVKRIG